MEPVALQEILGVDKKNPLFTLCKSPEQPGKLLVFFGACLFEVVADDPQNPAFKLLFARLYNAGVSPKAILEIFPFSYTTLRHLGDALRSGDAKRLMAYGLQYFCLRLISVVTFRHPRLDSECGGSPLLWQHFPLRVNWHLVAHTMGKWSATPIN